MQDKKFAVLSVPRGGTGGVWRVDLSGQNASIAATDLVPAAKVTGGLYVIKGVARVTTAAATSGSVNVQIGFTEADGNSAISGVNTVGVANSGAAVLVTTPGNTTGNTGIFYFLQVINAKAGIAISYATNYASNPASAMVYSLHLVASRF